LGTQRFLMHRVELKAYLASYLATAIVGS